MNHIRRIVAAVATLAGAVLAFAAAPAAFAESVPPPGEGSGIAPPPPPPDPLVANHRQAGHCRPSAQVTVLPCPSKTVRVRAGCGTSVLYAKACHGTVPPGTIHCTGWPVTRAIRSKSLS